MREAYAEEAEDEDLYAVKSAVTRGGKSRERRKKIYTLQGENDRGESGED